MKSLLLIAPGNERIESPIAGKVECTERLGGILKHYRMAAWRSLEISVRGEEDPPTDRADRSAG